MMMATAVVITVIIYIIDGAGLIIIMYAST